jgi:hypothetical protein
MKMDEIKTLKDYAQILVYVFLAGGAWTMVKFLKDSVTEIKVTLEKINAVLNSHETRITVIESRKGKK